MSTIILKILRIFAILFVSAIFILISYYKAIYVYDFTNHSFLYNPGLIKSEYPLDPSILSKTVSGSNKWIYNLVLSFVYVVLSTAWVHLVFQLKKLTILTGVVYVVLGAVSMIFLITGILIQNKYLAYSETRFIKDYLIQSPFVVLLISALAWRGKK